MKVIIDRGDSLNNCDTKIELVPYQTLPPYVITWWDNSWQPSTGLHAENICEGTILTTEILDMNCRHLRAAHKILPDSIPQVYLDTVIAVLPSAPGLCDGSIIFRFKNVSPFYTRFFSNSSSGGVTLDSVFTNLCEDYYTYSISQGGVIAEVTVSLHYVPILPCEPFSDSLIITPQSAPGSCDAIVNYNSSGALSTGMYYHYIYKPVGTGSVTINADSALSYGALCSGPHIVQGETYGISNNYFVSNTIFVDNPLIKDSVWGNPGAGQIDTIYLSAITNCGINYSFNVDSVYISKMNYIAGNQFEIEITVLQLNLMMNFDTILSFETANVDTSHQLCFDLTFFCSDSSTFKTLNSEVHNYIFFPLNGLINSVSNQEILHGIVVLYPNPANNYLKISNLPAGENIITVYSIEGRVLEKSRTSKLSYDINLKDVPSGLYLLQIDNGIELSVQKFIINRE